MSYKQFKEIMNVVVTLGMVGYGAWLMITGKPELGLLYLILNGVWQVQNKLYDK